MLENLEFKEKFQVNRLKIIETEYWVVSLRPAQPTIGSVILSLKRSCPSLSQITSEEGAGFPLICAQIEKLLTEKFGADKFNYLALMMVDEQVHFHVIPRYSSSVFFNNEDYLDHEWPKPVDILKSKDVDIEGLLKYLVD